MSSEEVQETQIAGEPLEVQTQRNRRGKTGGYFRSESAILEILDSHGNRVTGVWGKEWSECAPGIETRDAGENSKFVMGGINRMETQINHCVRIHREACPVSIHFIDTDEYIDYGDAEYSSSHRRQHWVRYVR